QDDRFVLIAGRKRLVAARAAQCREVPCLVHTADDARAQDLAEAANAASDERRERVPAGDAPALRVECDALSDNVLPEIQHALSSVQRSLRLLPQAPPATRERVAMRLIAAELERAQWLVRGRRYLAGRVPVAPRAMATADLAKDFGGVAAAIALHGGRLAVEAAEPARVIVDAPLLTAAVYGLAWALLALGETVGDRHVRVTIARGRREGATVLTVAQPAAVLNQQTLLRFFEAGWKARPGGAAAEMAVQLAHYAAARHGAELEVSSGAGSGTAIALTLR
ncbi:MAG: ParB N-terminal domain-containing protein, partial [Vicinamibacterales bacterium]